MVHSLYNQKELKTSNMTLNLAELLGSLSYALDMTEALPEGHSVRCAWTGYKIGEVLGLQDDQLADLYYTLLLKDLGCSSTASTVSDVFATDDIALKRNLHTCGASAISRLKFFATHTGTSTSLGKRFKILKNVIKNGEAVKRKLIEMRCDRGASIAGRMQFSEFVQMGIRGLNEHWDGSGGPLGVRGDAVPVHSSIALLTRVMDAYLMSRDKDVALKEIRKLDGVWFRPEVVAAFEQVQSEPHFWETLQGAEVEQHLFALPPAMQSEKIDEDRLDEIASAFSDVVDAKSPFTADHSDRVTQYTDLIAIELGLTAEHRRWLRRAALLHDLGKLGVSNQILDKPGKLTDVEWIAVKNHPFFSERILERVSAFKDIAPIAGAHHERLDGKGYPYGLKGEEICLEVRILTVADVFDALTAKRPYRDALPTAKALEILDKGLDTAFDGTCIAALKSALLKRDCTPVAA